MAIENIWYLVGLVTLSLILLTSLGVVDGHGLGIDLLLRATAVGGAGLLQLVPEGAEHLVQGRPAGPVVTLEEPVVEVVVLV